MQYIRGSIALLGITISSAFFSVFFVGLRLLNIICLRQKQVNIIYNFLIKRVYFLWTKVNEVMLFKVLRIKVDLPELPIQADNWYVLLSNHQSFFDILILQIFCLRHKLYNKFFMKESLIFLPFIGISCWGLDFVFIKRFSRQELKKNPAKLTNLYQYIREKCQYFSTYPCTTINFVEGTRYTQAKAEKVGYKNTLAPQPMGLSIILQELGAQKSQIIDVAIAYDEAQKNFLDFFFKENVKLALHCRLVAVKQDLIGDYRQDKQYRQHFNAWLKSLWQEKDDLLTKLKQQLHD